MRARRRLGPGTLCACLWQRVVGGSVCLVASTACGIERAPTVSQRDSVGIQIVESLAPDWKRRTGFRIRDAPLAEIGRGNRGGPYALYEVNDATLMPDGTVVIADGGSHEVRLFDARGTFLTAVGGRGEGPGEFLHLSSVERYGGDSLAVLDRRQNRITILGPALATARVFRPQTGAGRLREVRPLDTPGFVALVAGEGGAADRDGYYRPTYGVVRLTADGKMVARLAALPGLAGYASSGVVLSAPFAADAHIDVREDIVTIGSSDGLEFRQLEIDGEVLRIIRVLSLDFRLSVIAVERERAAIMEGMLPTYRKLVEDMVFPEHRPGYADLLVDSEGFIWTAEYQGRAEEATAVAWHVFNPDGELLGKVEMPSRFEVFEIGDDYVLGKVDDELGIEVVQILGLERVSK